MTWQKQMEDMVASWTDTQRRLWDQWMDAMKGVAPGAEQWQQEYHRALDAWEKSVREALARQQEWARTWTEQGAPEVGGQEAAQQWMGQAQEVMRNWTEAQSRLWSTWLESAQKMDASSADAPWLKGAQDVMRAWQEAATNAQASMEELRRSVAPSAGSADEASSGKGKGPSEQQLEASKQGSADGASSGKGKGGSGGGSNKKS